MIPLFGYLVFWGLGSYYLKVGYPKKGVWYEPTGRVRDQYHGACPGAPRTHRFEGAQPIWSFQKSFRKEYALNFKSGGFRSIPYSSAFGSSWRRPPEQTSLPDSVPQATRPNLP